MAKPPKLTSEKAAEYGRKGGARTAELRRQGKIGNTSAPLCDAKAMAADVLRMMQGDDD